MNEDNKLKLTNKDYGRLIIGIFILTVIICLPAGILLGFDYLTHFKYHWIAWGILFVGIFLIGLFSKQIVNKLNL